MATEPGGDSGRGSQPRSWAEDLQTYRAARGSRAQATVEQSGFPER